MLPQVKIGINCNVRKGNVSISPVVVRRVIPPDWKQLRLQEITFTRVVYQITLPYPFRLDLHGAEDVEALSAALPREKFAPIVIDTLAMSMGAGSENDSKDMAQYIQNIIALRSGFSVT